MTYFKILVIIFSLHIINCSLVLANNSNILILSENEIKAFKSAIKEGNKKKWARTLKYLPNIKNKTAKKIITWRWLIANDGIAELNDLKKFYSSNKNWPKVNSIVKKIENKMSFNDFKVAMNWFQDNPPTSAIAKVKLAKLLLKNNFEEEGQWLLKETWISNTFTLKEEKYILNNFKSLITTSDNTKRIEKLIWKKKWGSANRQLKRVSPDIRKLSTAKIKLSRRRGNVDNAITNVPNYLLNEEGLVFERIKWRRRAKLEKSSLELLLKYNNNINYPKKWWREVNYHTRKQLSYGNIDTALNLLNKYNSKSNKYLAESSWLSGWLSLTFNKNPRIGYEHFSKMFIEVVTPISKARSAYWAGKSAKTLGDREGSTVWYERAASYPATFYGQLALRELEKDLYMPTFNNKLDVKDYDNYKTKELVKALIILLQTDEKVCLM